MKNAPPGTDIPRRVGVLFQQLGGRAKGEYEFDVRVGHAASTVRRPMEITTLVVWAWSGGVLD